VSGLVAKGYLSARPCCHFTGANLTEDVVEVEKKS
jgi:hypothetical protein